MTLDDVLNILVPILIFGGLTILIYSKASKPIDKFFAKIKEWIIGQKEKVEEVTTNQEWGPISYRGAQY